MVVWYYVVRCDVAWRSVVLVWPPLRHVCPRVPVVFAQVGRTAGQCPVPIGEVTAKHLLPIQTKGKHTWTYWAHITYQSQITWTNKLHHLYFLCENHKVPVVAWNQSNVGIAIEILWGQNERGKPFISGNLTF